MNLKARFFSLTQIFLLSFSASAAFMVEQYDDFWSSNLNDLQNYANSNAASTTGDFDYIDFTDYNRDNDFAGFNLWPSDAANGSSDSFDSPVNETFFIRITGTFDIASSGDYNLRTLNDDGIFLFVDGILEINDPTFHPINRFETDTLALSAGTHELELFMFERYSAADLEVSIRQGSGSYSLLRSSTVPEPSIIALMGAGLLGMGFVRRKIRK